MEKTARIYVAGHEGLVGSAVVRALRSEGHTRVIGADHTELDLTDPAGVRGFFNRERPEYVFLVAARVGGILANQTYPGDFIRTNLWIQMSVLEAALQTKVKRLLFFGCACVYPRVVAQPMSEESLLTGPLEPTSEAFALAKLAGIKACEAYNRQYGTRFLSLIPASIFGPHDSFDPENSHVLSALIRKCHEAKRTGEPVQVWGSGDPRREFLYVDDVVRASLFLMNTADAEFDAIVARPRSVVNAGAGEDIRIRELAALIAEVVGLRGQITFDPGRPDGAPQKLLDSSKIRRLGWAPKTSLEEGVRRTYDWYRQQA